MPVIDLGRVIGPQGPQGEVGAQGIRGEQGLPGPNQVTNSTATPLTGVLTGNGSVVGVESIDSAPTADSTGFARSGGTYTAIKERAPNYGKGKNLLRNWYFVGGGTGRGVFPVNQRGFTTSSGVNHVDAVDGWWINGGRGTQTLNANGIYLNNTATSGTATIQQWVGVGAEYEGKAMTLSALADNVLVAATFTVPVKTNSDQTVVRLYFNDGCTVIFYTLSSSQPGYAVQFTVGPGYSMTIKGVKLELGTEQTLCHNEGTANNPVWIFNEFPDYEEELIKCQTSIATTSGTDILPNKSLATEQQIAYVENGTTATKTNGYAIGEYFCWHGLLYRAKTAIGNGDTFIENTNCEQAPVSSGLIKQRPFSGTTSSNYGGIDGILPSGLGDIVSIKITKVGTGAGINAYAIPFVGTGGKLSSALFYNVVTGSLKSTAIEGIAYYL